MEVSGSRFGPSAGGEVTAPNTACWQIVEGGGAAPSGWTPESEELVPARQDGETCDTASVSSAQLGAIIRLICLEQLFAETNAPLKTEERRPSSRIACLAMPGLMIHQEAHLWSKEAVQAGLNGFRRRCGASQLTWLSGEIR